MPRRKTVFSKISDIKPEELRCGVKYTVCGIQNLELLTCSYGHAAILGYRKESEFQRRVIEDIKKARPAAQAINGGGDDVGINFFLAKTSGMDLRQITKDSGYESEWYYCDDHLDEINCLVYDLSENVRVIVYASGKIEVYNDGKCVFEKDSYMLFIEYPRNTVTDYEIRNEDIPVICIEKPKDKTPQRSCCGGRKIRVW